MDYEGSSPRSQDPATVLAGSIHPYLLKIRFNILPSTPVSTKWSHSRISHEGLYIVHCFVVRNSFLSPWDCSSLVFVCRGQCFQWHLKVSGSSKTCICMCTSVCVLPAFSCNMWLCIAYCIFGQQALLISACYERHVTDVVPGTPVY